MRSTHLMLVAVLAGNISCGQSRLNLGDSLFSIIQKSLVDNNLQEGTGHKSKSIDDVDVVDARNKARVVQRAREEKDNLNKGSGILSQYSAPKSSVVQSFQMDPVLNDLKRSGLRRDNRKPKKRSKWTSSELDTSSSSREIKDWKEEWNELWIKKKIEALNTSAAKGDMVNMVAARPWGVPCGDPKLHDMPWGTCMLAAECDAEYRIYRGDSFCGRTNFVCCALQLNTYDMYQGFDVSFDDTSLETDSAEERDRNKYSKEKRRRRKQRDKRRRRKNRERRKRKIKRKIRRIVREVEKILNRAYRNGSTIRRKKTKTLKRYVKYLKKKYKQERGHVKDIHEIQLIKVDNDLMKRIMEISQLNKNFMRNDTFRDIVMNGTMSASGARMLVEAYPELNSIIGVDGTRRSGNSQPPKDYLNYDIEYGLVYS